VEKTPGCDFVYQVTQAFGFPLSPVAVHGIIMYCTDVSGIFPSLCEESGRNGSGLENCSDIFVKINSFNDIQ